MSEMGRAAEGFGVQAHYPVGERVREHGILTVRKYDGDMADWVSRKLGGGIHGKPDYITPHERHFREYGIDPYEIVESVSNLFTTAGWQRIMNLMAGLAATAAASGWASGAARIGVGTATAAAANSQTDLQAATGSGNRWFNMVTGAGSTGTGTGAGNSRLSFVATFASGDANFSNAWQEWCIDAGTAGSGFAAATAPMMNRAVSNLGTKASPAVWTATAQLDFG
jgi:hypothetical protein